MVTIGEGGLRSLRSNLRWVKPPQVAYSNAWQAIGGGGLIDPRPARLQVTGDFGSCPQLPFPVGWLSPPRVWRARLWQLDYELVERTHRRLEAFGHHPGPPCSVASRRDGGPTASINCVHDASILGGEFRWFARSRGTFGLKLRRPIRRRQIPETRPKRVQTEGELGSPLWTRVDSSGYPTPCSSDFPRDDARLPEFTDRSTNPKARGSNPLGRARKRRAPRVLGSRGSLLYVKYLASDGRPKFMGFKFLLSALQVPVSSMTCFRGTLTAFTKCGFRPARIQQTRSIGATAGQPVGLESAGIGASGATSNP